MKNRKASPLSVVWILILAITSGILISSPVFAYHPLITDDTGTQGKGRFQFEFNVEYGHDESGDKTETTIGTTLTYGIVENLDGAIGIPYQFLKESNGETVRNDGISDISVDLKYRFYERDNLKLALKPGVSIPVGDHEKRLGTGKITGRIFLIVEKAIATSPITLFLNAGYIRNENKLGERIDLWHISLAGEYKLREDLKIALNTGMERNPEKDSDTHPAFILGGVVYSIGEDLDLSAGIKGGLNRAETDLSLLAGVTVRF